MRTFLVVGADGKRYGPADVPTLLRWVQEGRLVAGTVLVDAATNESLSAVSIPELKAAFFEPASRGTPQNSGGGAPNFEATQTAYRPPAGGLTPPTGLQPLRATLDESLSERSKVTAGLLGIFLGWCGAHRFYLGYTGIGVLMILATFCCGIGAIWGFIEGIMCLAGAMRDAEGKRLRD